MTEKEINKVMDCIIRSSHGIGRELEDMVYKELNKQNPKKPKVSEDKYYSGILEYRCPVCNAYFGKRGKRDVILFRKEKYCDCGQKIDWNEV